MTPSHPLILIPPGGGPAGLRRFAEGVELREIATLAGVEFEDRPTLLLLSEAQLADVSPAGASPASAPSSPASAPSDPSPSAGAPLSALPPEVVVLSLDEAGRRAAEGAGRHFLSLEGPAGEGDRLPLNLRAALRHASALQGATHARETLDRMRGELRELNRVGMALMSERDPEALLTLILTQARRITTSDAGSLYLVEEVDGEARLRFRLAQNDSIPGLPAPEFSLPISEASIAGYVASTGAPLVIEDAYALPAGVPFTFNPSFDLEFGYRARSMLAVPMKDHRERTVGVLQLINRKREAGASIRNAGDADAVVLPYSEAEVETVHSLAGQAAVSIENQQLLRNIEGLFEGFIKAAVIAIDQRDPTTSGHSVRVATLTCDLAEAADRAHSGPFRGVTFSREQMKELRYAGLLHDFGKVGVREQVLVKSKKLPPVMLERIEARFDFIRRTLESEFHRKRADLAFELGAEAAHRKLPQLLEEYESARARIDRFQQSVREANEPRVLPEEASEALLEIAATEFPDLVGNAFPVLDGPELHFLSIRKGSLDPEERKQIESHVSLTYQFLQQIPWTEDLAKVAEIARGHHEKLDGTGYPLGVSAEVIPVQTRMMTVSDIFDALTASDRPYKKALPPERAFSILEMEAKDGQLDSEVVRLMIDSGVYRKVLEDDWRNF